MLWKEVWNKIKRGKRRFAIRDLLADDRCSKAVLDFLSTTEVGRLVPPPAEEDAQNEVPEWELRERKPRGWAQGSRNRCSSPRPPLWHLRKRSENGFLGFFIS